MAAVPAADGADLEARVVRVVTEAPEAPEGIVDREEWAVWADTDHHPLPDLIGLIWAGA